MPGPRAGYSGFYDMDSITGIEWAGSAFTSSHVHRRCQDGADCSGPGCVVRTGKTSGKLAEHRKMRDRMELALRRREAVERGESPANA